jgi:YD repeat-containing protein
MLKPLLLSALALGICLGLNAQTQPVLLAESGWEISNNNLVPKDSVIFTHSGSRNSKPEPRIYGATWAQYGKNTYHYDTAWIYRPTNNVLQPAWQVVHSFNSADSLAFYYENQYSNITSSYQPKSRATYTFLPGNLVDSVLQEMWGSTSMAWATDRRTKYEYDMSGRVIASDTKLWDAANMIWDMGHYDSTFYDMAGRVSTYTTYSYDLITNTLSQTQQHNYTYDGSGRKSTDTFFLNNARYNLHCYEYDVNGNMVTDSAYGWDNNNAVWKLTGKQVYTYDANNNMLVTTAYSWNNTTSQYVPSSRSTLTYNSTNQMTLAVLGEKWENGVWNIGNGARYLRYYYGAVPINVSQHENEMSSIALYPVPASSYINLDLNFDRPTNFSATIIDMQGRVVKHFTGNAGKTYHKNIIVQDLPAGQYMMQVKTGQGVTSKNFTVIR